MHTNASLSADPNWIPHRIDLQAGQAHFLKLPKEAFAAPMFLADFTAKTALDSATISLDALEALEPEAGPLHFIFHSAFCRSTLLVRTLNIAGVVTGMSEPGIIANIAGAGEAGARYIEPCLRLLARPRTGPDGLERAVFVKPTNLANRLIPALMQTAPQSKAVMMSNSLPAFLQSINRKGLMGRRWARNLYLEVQSYAPLDLGISTKEIFLLSDLQVAGLAWLLQRRWFEMNMSGPAGERMRSLDSERFNDDRTGSIRSIAEFAGLGLTDAQSVSAANSEIFTTHAKQGGDYLEAEELAVVKSESPVFDEEVGMVGEWIDLIAQQAGLGEAWKRAI